MASIRACREGQHSLGLKKENTQWWLYFKVTTLQKLKSVPFTDENRYVMDPNNEGWNTISPFFRPQPQHAALNTPKPTSQDTTDWRMVEFQFPSEGYCGLSSAGFIFSCLCCKEGWYTRDKVFAYYHVQSRTSKQSESGSDIHHAAVQSVTSQQPCLNSHPKKKGKSPSARVPQWGGWTSFSSI